MPTPSPSPPDAEALAPLLRRAFSIFPTGVDQVERIERVAEGVSTWVYRIRRGGETFYLRILPEADATFAPEVIAHQRLRYRRDRRRFSRQAWETSRARCFPTRLR